jgi:hypothetical protein
MEERLKLVTGSLQKRLVEAALRRLRGMSKLRQARNQLKMKVECCYPTNMVAISIHMDVVVVRVRLLYTCKYGILEPIH